MSLILAAAALAPQSPATTPTALAAAAPWNVEFAPAHCVLSRPFGTGADRVTLVLNGDWVSDRFDLLVIGPQSEPGLKRGRIGLGTVDGSPPLEIAAESSLNDRLGKRVTTVHIEGAALAQSKRIELAPVSGSVLPFSIVLVTGSMSKPWQAFDACRADLARKWGVDPASLERVAVKARLIGNPGAFFGSDAYPAAAKALRIGGDVEMRLVIDTTGRPIGCHIVKVSPLASLDAETCAIVLRSVLFTPAKDKAGQPVSSEYSLEVSWRLAS